MPKGIASLASHIPCKATVLLAAVVAATPASPQQPSTRELVARASAYVANYQQQLTAVVADEEYTQEILEQNPPDPLMPRMRRLRSEVFFLFEPVGQQWMAIRDTILVDGLPVRNRPDVRRALQTLSPSEIGRRLSEYNARWNLGGITRNFNEPTIGLLILEPGRVARSKFDRKAVAQTADGPLVTLAFTERERPTLIANLSSRPVYSRGEIVMDPTGPIRKTTFRVETDGVRVELTTEYAQNAKLDMWVPSVFRERYERRRNGRELIVCEATYTNYRRFDVVTRIK